MRKLSIITTCVLLATLASPLLAATGTIAPFPRHQFFDNNGDPCTGCLLFTYVAGSSTKVSTYSEVSLTTANANPLTLPSNGRATIFLTPGVSYKFILAPATDVDPPLSPLWTVDNVGAVPPTGTATDVDITGTAGENLSAGDAVYLSDGTGGATTGRWYKADSDNTYSSTLAQAVGFTTAAITTGASGTIRRGGRVTGLSGLTSGTLYYISATSGAITSTPPTNALPILQADSTTSGVIIESEPSATATVPGLVSITTQTFAGNKTFTGTTTFSGRVTITPRNPLANDFTDHATSGTGATDVWSVSVPGGTLANGETLYVEAYGDLTSDANSKTYAFQLGSTAYSSGTTGGTTTAYHMRLAIARVSASVQRVIADFIQGTTIVNTVYTAGTENLDNTLTLKITLTHATSGTTTQRVVRTWVEPAS